MNKREFIFLICLSVLSFGTAGVLTYNREDLFKPYFGSFDPLMMVGLAAIAAFISLAILKSFGFEILNIRACRGGFVRAATTATGFGLAVLFVDVVIGFPRDLNVPLPLSLLFYPVMAFVAETVFHILPLMVILLVTGWIFGVEKRDKVFWIAAVIVSGIESLFQVLAGCSEGVSVTIPIFVSIHLFAFSLLQLYLFRRFDFAAMLLFRLVYYLHWHLIWGYLRISFLFGE